MRTLKERMPATTGQWMADPGFGIYVHIPFCRHRCSYCDFNTYEGLDELHEPYVAAVVKEIETWQGPGRTPSSVFFGGGTPTLLAPSMLHQILDAVKNRFGMEPGAEVTVEANPETVDQRTFEELLEAGFNRVSIGVQSLVGSVLKPLGRTHSPERALEALRAARRAGVDNLNADLIYGSPWESGSDWATTLERIVQEGPDHISAYALTIEDGTPLATLVASGRAPQVDPDVQAERHAVAEDVLSANGLERYEVSNWARPGAASCHNVLYWSAGDYLGFGAGAHGHLAGRRYWCTRLPRDLIAAIERGESTEAGYEVLDGRQRVAEALVLGLRLASGVDLDAFADRFGTNYVESIVKKLDDLEDLGLLDRDGRWVRLSARGTLLANEVACRLL
jgi:putative oxygen-independent coproporphyrinogen III oxidase